MAHPNTVELSHGINYKKAEIMTEEKKQYKPGDMLSTQEAADFLGISRQRLNVLLNEERIPGAIKVNKYWAIPFETLLELPERKPGNPHENN